MWRLKIGEGGNNPHLYSTNNFVGRQTWEFDPNAGTPEERAEVEEARQNFYRNRFQVKANSDLLWRMQFLREKNFKQTIPQVKIKNGEDITYETVTAAVKRGAYYLAALQASDGHWPAENSGSMFFHPPLVMCLYITGHLNILFSNEHRREMLRYIYYHQNEDGGWGLDVEGRSNMFGSVCNYICMRLLGEGPEGGENNACARAREWILHHGGATSIPFLGKFFLSILGVYDWAGVNPIPPEIWSLPTFPSIHPAKMVCFCRVAYLPMSYLYGKKIVGPMTPLILQLREEIYIQSYNDIKWSQSRHLSAKEDLCYYERPLGVRVLWDTLHNFIEPLLNHWPLSKLRDKSLQMVLDYINYEDEASRYINYACIEKAFSMLVSWVENPNGENFKMHLARVPDYLWLGEDGMKVQTFGSQTWDAGFAIQALIASNIPHEIGPTLKKGHEFLKKSQVRDNPSGNFKRYFRHMSKGSWTFSDQDHGWQVSDCTAESLMCCLLFSMLPSELVGEVLEPERLYDAVNIILYLQNGKKSWLKREDSWTMLLLVKIADDFLGRHLLEWLLRKAEEKEEQDFSRDPRLDQFY
ncbi:hypothetical protein REPUB_Repub15cG0108300 [Reevesia pubescens]